MRFFRSRGFHGGKFGKNRWGREIDEGNHRVNGRAFSKDSEFVSFVGLHFVSRIAGLISSRPLGKIHVPAGFIRSHGDAIGDVPLTAQGRSVGRIALERKPPDHE